MCSYVCLSSTYVLCVCVSLSALSMYIISISLSCRTAYPVKFTSSTSSSRASSGIEDRAASAGTVGRRRDLNSPYVTYRTNAHTPCILSCSCLQTITLSSMDKLLRHIEESQLTSDLGGFLPYNHKEWITFRLVSEITPTHSPTLRCTAQLLLMP